MKIKIFECNPLAVNTFVLSDETKECVVIDAACFYPDEREDLINYIIDNDLVVKHLINTHLHFDHIFGVNVVAEQFNVKMKCHKNDAFLLENIPQQLQLFGFGNSNTDYTPQIGCFLTEEDTITFGNQKLRIFHVPGHSPGSLVFYDEKTGSLFVGDVLFRGGIGRTDLVGGNYDQLVNGIRTKLFELPDETVVYPGHGPATTIGEERKNNPFVGINT